MVEITNGSLDETWRCDDRLAENLCGEGALDGTLDLEAGDRVIDEGRCCAASGSRKTSVAKPGSTEGSR